MTALKKVTRISLKRDPEHGERGAMPRLRKFVAGVRYLSGSIGEEFKDYVYYNGAWYGCDKTHTPSTTNPYSDSARWSVESAFAFLSTECIIIGSDGQGWILSEGKITHTLGKITFNADGSANFNNKCKISADGILESIGAIIRSIAGDREIRLDNFGISGMTGDELDFLMSNEKVNDLSVLRTGKINAKDIKCYDFSPKFTSGNQSGYDSEDVEVYWDWGPVCFGVLFLGYMEAGATLTMTASPTLRWVYPGWTLNEYMDEAALSDMRPATWSLDQLTVKVYKDGEFIGDLAWAPLQGYTGNTSLASSSWTSITLSKSSAGVKITESGMYSLRIVADRVRMSIDAQDFDYFGDDDHNTIVNGYSYPVDDADWMKNLFFMMQLNGVSLNINAVPFKGTAIFKDAIACINNESSLLYDSTKFQTLFGQYGFRVTDSGIQKTSDYGDTWTSI